MSSLRRLRRTVRPERLLLFVACLTAFGSLAPVHAVLGHHHHEAEGCDHDHGSHEGPAFCEDVHQPFGVDDCSLCAAVKNAPTADTPGTVGSRGLEPTMRHSVRVDATPARYQLSPASARAPPSLR